MPSWSNIHAHVHIIIILFWTYVALAITYVSRHYRTGVIPHGGEKPHLYSNSIVSSDNGVIEKRGVKSRTQGVEAAVQWGMHCYGNALAR